MINTNETQQESQAESQALIIQTAQAEQEQDLSIKPSILEIERFIQFLNNKYNLGIKNDLVVLIQKTSPNTKGYYHPNSWNINELVFKQQTEQQKAVVEITEVLKLNEITLSSFHLINTPYETIAHELAHYLNTLNGYKGNSNNYHTKEFKEKAELLGLAVEKGNYGYNITSETQQFKETLKEFEPNPQAFKIFQDIKKAKPKKPSRLLLFECSCKCKIRSAKNEFKPLKAICEYCNTEFKQKESNED